MPRLPYIGSPRLKIGLSVAASVLVTMAVMLPVSRLPGMAVPWQWWIVAALLPVLIAWPISFLLVHQSDAIVRLNADLTRANAALQRIAETDHLTGVANRAAFDARVAERSFAGVADGAGWFLIVDIDHFKAINDAHGHAVGDDALVAVARVLTAAATDAVVGRIGGEEFAIFLPGADEAAARVRAEAIRAGVAALAIPGPAGSDDGAAIALTVSIGIAGGTGLSPTNGLIAADRAMYRAKQQGRNRVRAER